MRRASLNCDRFRAVEPMCAAQRLGIAVCAKRRDRAPACFAKLGSRSGIVAERQEQRVARRAGVGQRIDQFVRVKRKADRRFARRASRAKDGISAAPANRRRPSP